MQHLYTYLALEIAHDRTREARDIHRAALLRAGLPARPALVRRGLAHGLAAVTRSGAAAVRRLDRRIADDLGRSLAPTE